MTTERWTSLLTAGDAGHSRNIEGKKMLEIELPTNVGVDAVNVFVKVEFLKKFQICWLKYFFLVFVY